MTLAPCTRGVLSAILLLCPLADFAADNKPTAVTALGTYGRVKATEDHAYGHEVRLWQSAGTRLIGQVLYWDGNPEAQKGLFTDGVYSPRSGEMQFTVTVTRRDVQPNIQTVASFTGRRVKNTVTGNLRWEGQAAQTRGKGGIENLNLLQSQNASLEQYPDVDSWRKAVTD